MKLPTMSDIEAGARIVYREFQATPQYRWALLSERLGTDCWVKHENHTPVGAFKIRGGLTYFEHLRQSCMPQSVISATRGNHGQSIGWAARSHGVPCRIVVPRGNSVEKNAAMRALGVTLIEHGADFQEAREHATELAAQSGAHMVPSFHAGLLQGVSTYWWEYFKTVPQLDVVYVPIGLGSGACSAIAARRALGHRARIVGVVSAAHGGSHFFQLVLPPLFPLLKASFGVGYAELGLLMGVLYGISGLTQTLAGVLVDRVGATRVLTGGLLLLGAGTLLASLAPAYPVLVLAAVKFEFEAANAVNVTVPAPVAVITPVDKLTVAEPLPTVLTL